MKITALWNALRGQPQQVSGQDEAKQEGQQQTPPCSLDEMDARIKALDAFVHENDSKLTEPKPPQPPAQLSADERKNPNALRTWFVLKSPKDP